MVRDLPVRFPERHTESEHLNTAEDTEAPPEHPVNPASRDTDSDHPDRVQVNKDMDNRDTASIRPVSLGMNSQGMVSPGMDKVLVMGSVMSKGITRMIITIIPTTPADITTTPDSMEDSSMASGRLAVLITAILHTATHRRSITTDSRMCMRRGSK